MMCSAVCVTQKEAQKGIQLHVYPIKGNVTDLD